MYAKCRCVLYYYFIYSDIRIFLFVFTAYINQYSIHLFAIIAYTDIYRKIIWSKLVPITSKSTLAPAYSGARGLREPWRRNAVDRVGTARGPQRRADEQNLLGSSYMKYANSSARIYRQIRAAKCEWTALAHRKHAFQALNPLGTVSKLPFRPLPASGSPRAKVGLEYAPPAQDSSCLSRCGEDSTRYNKGSYA